MIKVILISILTVSFSAYAKPKAYFDVDSGWFARHPRVIVDGVVYERKMFGYAGVSKAFIENPEAVKWAEKSESLNLWGNAFVWGGVIAAVGYALSTDSSDYKDSAAWGTFFAGFIPGTILLNMSRARLLRAVNQYNGIYSSSAASQWRMHLTPIKSGALVGLNFNF